jgi:predicted transposase/invertase (TIGR01784 family)
MTPPDTRKALGDVTHEETNILPAYDDAIFKTLLTHPDANAVLRDVISSILMTPVDEVIVRNTEMPLSDIGEKRERFDVNCRTSTGELIALEMQSVPMKGDSGLSGHTNIRARCAYNLCDLHATQSGKGVDYADLTRSYQVMFCNYTVFSERTSFVGRYSLRDEGGIELTDAICAVFIELSKLGPVLKKDAKDMEPLEAWSVFFATAHKPEFKELIDKLSGVKEEVGMANSLLLDISQDEIQQAHFRSRRIFERDMEHNYAVGVKEGRAEGLSEGLSKGLSEGISKGRAEGLSEGLSKGLSEGISKGRAEAAKGFKAKGVDPQTIAEVTGLSLDEVLSL